MSIARFVAGPERSDWLDAIEAELDHLPARRLDWALGSLVAAVKDRAAREWSFALALVLGPTAALAAIPVIAIASASISGPTGLSTLQLMPLTVLSPLPFAIMLGAVRPRFSPLVAGALGFAAYQAIPAIALTVIMGRYAYFRWEANLSHYGLLPPSGLLATLALWCAGAWLGARWARRRKAA